ncbi:NAD-dependent succinate-semialdehyde dehydrogenase [Flexivirga oryzae]|uniref:Succinate-semialdehyde dehydrogenase/glutarate-semialdehyde dehydrogenase n=1 Tax=Flexivirga oryzae TaxID=1794944 RepID=A0A839N776_9MICO|nr:NAD-dependent succinate-semialdehyde dehydrogenase [Flexivirga oryzae]MBB2891874.1 succinate-semialdehyde dehydrogenase/glutarate-semialdehyde dehydrogenase [Flexivirga oryzae]
MATVTTISPIDGSTLQTYEAADWAVIDAVLDRAVTAQQRWASRPVGDRTELLRAVAGILRGDRERHAALITAEMGKPITESLAEVDKCARNCDVVAEEAPGWLADRELASDARRSWVAAEPLGVVFAVMPWNYPFWQVIRFACAALVAGNAGVLKHSPNVTGCALALADVFAKAGAPDALFQTVVIAEADVPEVVPRIIADDRVAAVTLTGSERAGSAVGAAAGKALKKSLLELGGSDPFVVLADADLDHTVAQAVRSRFGNGGQSCIAAKRFVVVDEIADEFVARLSPAVARLRLGDPADPDTQVGPMARPDLLAALHAQVQASVREGAELVTGGKSVGTYYLPTILDRVTPNMTAATEETFGPVAAILRARDDDQAVEMANATAYGLGCSVWGEPAHALAVGRRIRSGALFVNAMVASDPRLPFGGIRRSGHGRELAADGVREFTNQRTVYVGGVR